MQEIQSNHCEERDLIILRNTLVQFLSKAPEYEMLEKENEEKETTVKQMDLPEPINFRNACTKCPYNTICSVYAERDRNLQLPESHPLKTIANETMNHLEPQHIEYVMNWITMLQLDEPSNCNLGALKNIWILEPAKR